MKPRELTAALARQAGLGKPDGKHCVKCRQPFRFNPGPAAQKQGDIYSQAGLTEATKMSGLCEFCFDQQFGE